MCSDTPTAPYSWKIFFSCCDLLSFFSSVPLTLLPVVAVILLGSCTQTKVRETLEGRSKDVSGHHHITTFRITRYSALSCNERWVPLFLHLLLLLLSCISRVWLCATPQTAVHQAPPSLGFSRQQHWSGLPFPSPMHESEKWKWSRSVVSDS